MNGDIGKLPSGAVYPTTPESLAVTAPTSDYSGSLNGVTDSLETYVQANSPPGGSLADPSPGSDAGIPLDQLKQMLSSQLEYYFSRENLANDAYLLSQMDNDQYVPIWTVANFNQVKKLTKDIKLITEVLRESPNVQVDEEGIKVRPNHKRCIVILREIPDNTPLDEVKALFSGEGCPRLISCEFAHNNSWYVTFESDEDAQKAYRFLREEVREFQGRPIMARIKAKPMNRLPLPPVSAMGAAAIKNGYRSPPTAMYDPNSYQGQQRFLYSNGSSLPPNVNYGNQVQIYAFQHQQPFYPPGMLQPWHPAGPGFMELGGVFSFNGLAPQAPFTKPQGSRTYNPRNRNKRNQPLGDRSSLSDVMNLGRHSAGSHSYHHHLGGMGSSVTGTVGGTHTKNSSNISGNNTSVGGKLQTVAAVGVINDMHHSKSHQSTQECSDTSSVPSQNLPGTLLRGDSEDYRQSRDLLAAKEPMPPRHRRRRKEDEVVGTGRTTVIGSGKPVSSGSPQPANRESMVPSSRGAQFDLEATAFPPLPGMDNGVGVNTKNTVPVETVPIDTSNSHWENRTVPVATKLMADKSTKTDDTLLSSDFIGGSQSLSSKTGDGHNMKHALPAPANVVFPASKPVPPTTTNAATMTSAVVVSDVTTAPSRVTATTTVSSTLTASSVIFPSTSNASDSTINSITVASASNVCSSHISVFTGAAVIPTSATNIAVSSSVESSGATARPSYAQVAQHHKEKVERMLREKQTTELQEKEKKEEKERKKEAVMTRVTHGDLREPIQREFKDGSTRYLGMGRGRPGPSYERPDRGMGVRRRDMPDKVCRFRDIIRPRSPK